jgi:hypothetical protein
LFASGGYRANAASLTGDPLEVWFGATRLTLFFHPHYFSIMVKTQIQLPDDLYRELKRLAAAKEWSLAETLRRGAEQLLQQFPDPGTRESTIAEWQPPLSTDCGWTGLSAEQLAEQIWEVAEPRLAPDRDPS